MNREQFIAQLARLLQDLPPAERQEAIRYYQEYFDDAGEENEDAVIQELGSPGKVAASIKANLQYGGSTFGANDTDMENTGTESQTKDADGWQQNGQTMNRWNQSTQQGWQNADTQGQNGQQGTWQNADTQGQNGQQQTWQNSSSTQSPYAMQARKPKRGVGGWALLIIILVFASPVLLGVGGGALCIFIGILATVSALWISFFTVAIGMIGGGIAVLIKGILHVISSPAAGLVSMGGGLICIALGILCAVFFLWFTFQLCPRVLRTTLNFISRIVHKGKEARAE